MPASLRADGLCKSYRRRKVVKEVSFEVNPGEIVGLLGPNGAGKTTSFNMVAGLLPADAGTVWLGEQNLGNLPLYRRARLGLGYLAQETTIFKGLSVLNNFMAVYQALNFSQAEGLKQAEQLLERFRHRL